MTTIMAAAALVLSIIAYLKAGGEFSSLKQDVKKLMDAHKGHPDL